MILPDIEHVSAAVHAAWMDSKLAQGTISRLSEDDEELMVPYDQLSEKAKELDRATVRAVYAAILSCQVVLTEADALADLNDTPRPDHPSATEAA